MNYDVIRSMIMATKGKTFTVEFTKKNGEARTMNCRIGVTKHLRGGESTTAHKPNLITVYDMKTGGYRCINLDTLNSFKFAGKTHKIN